MDPVTIFGIVTGAIGLIPLCADGFNFVARIFDANNELSSITVVLDVHETTFRQWQRVLRIDNLTGDEAVQAFRQTVPDIQQEFVLKYLVLLSNLFAKNAEGYSKYGIERTNDQSLSSIKELPIRPQDWKHKFNDFLGERKRHMNLMKRAKFILRDAQKFKDFSDQIGLYLGQLLQTMTFFHVQAMARGLIPDIVSDRRPHTAYENHRTSALIEQMAELQRSSNNGITQFQVDLLKTTAEFASMVRNADKQKFIGLADRFTRYSKTDSGVWSISRNDRVIGMMVTGYSTNPINVYYIEWKQYENNAGRADEILRSYIEALSKVASMTNPSPEFRVLRCLGAIHEADRMRYGLVYEVPSHVRTIQASSVPSGEVSRRRKPISLANLLEDPENVPAGLDLGSRIELINRIAQSLFLLHAASWVHKNICSDSIIFFRAKSTKDNSPSSTGRLDFMSPYLCGFGQSRPDTNDTTPVGPENQRDRVRRQPLVTVGYTPETKVLFSESRYQHPYKRSHPERPYLPCFDVYSLGCVMLEIGLWEPLSTLASDDKSTPEETQRKYINIAIKELPNQAGKYYANATKRCLEIRESDDPQRGREVLQRTIEDLSRIVV